MRIVEGSARYSIQIARLQGSYRLKQGGTSVLATVRSRAASELAALMPRKAAADTSRLLLCPMPGLVVSVNVTPGQDVKTGETLAVVEAMKMENVLTAERDGTIKTVNVKKGDSLALDDVILEFA
jgi:propionyl-CoA carboxylase alpha chain